jgi:hypothetical protein
VVVTDPMQEMVALNVISRPTGVVVELNTITKIYKYRRLHEGHCFILMAMEVHDKLRHDMDHFIKECACLSTINDREVIYPCLFAFNFAGNMLVLLFNMF